MWQAESDSSFRNESVVYRCGLESLSITMPLEWPTTDLISENSAFTSLLPIKRELCFLKLAKSQLRLLGDPVPQQRCHHKWLFSAGRADVL